MTDASFTSSRTDPALLRRLQYWIWAAVFFSLLLAGTITWIHFESMNAIDRTSRLLENVRTARIDMAKGFLYVSLSGQASSPFERGQGFALLQQSIDDYYAVTGAIELNADMDSADSAVFSTFRHTLDSFTQQLKAWKASPQAAAQEEARLRIAFYDLERQSERLDAGIRDMLMVTHRQQNAVFVTALVVSILLLSGICGALLLSVRAVRRSDVTLVQSEDRFARAFHGVPVALAITRISDGSIMDVNERFLHLFGFTKEETLGSTFIALKLISSADVREDIIGRLLEKGSVSDYSVIMYTKGGAKRRILVSVEPLRLGDVPYALTSFLDITERVRYEQTLRDNEALLQETGRIAKVGAWRADLETGFMSWSEIVAQIHNREGAPGLPLEEWFALYAEASRATLMRAMKEASSSARAFDHILEIATAKGSRKWVRVIGHPVTEEERTVAVRGSMQDVTIIKAAEELMRESEDRLFHAQKMDSIGTLAAGIAHDFNNILGIMMGYADLLRLHLGRPEKAAHALAMMTNAINRGAGLVKQLLTFARKTPTIYAPTNVNTIINELRALFHETFPKTITIELALADDLPEIDADATQLHQVVLNLCVNARDAMPRGGTLSISTGIAASGAIREKRHEYPPRRYVTITIADTGMGMDEAVQKRIFEPFFTTKEPGKGTGLGLSVVFGIIENHHGAIDVRSERGKGTVFTLYLPVPAGGVILHPTDAAMDEAAGSGSETILLVEDEPMLRSLISEGLTAQGYRVISAGDGKEGFDLYRTHKEEIAVVFSDIGLPGIDGIEMARRIRADNPQAKIILASGYLSPEARREMETAGLRDFIQKPCPIPAVVRKIRATIDEESGI
ncbi:MAG: ATP-binding protein [Acidobacteriota bacterium]